MGKLREETLAKRVKELEAEIERLREALRPFANAYDGTETGWSVPPVFSRSDFTRARKALEPK